VPICAVVVIVLIRRVENSSVGTIYESVEISDMV